MSGIRGGAIPGLDRARDWVLGLMLLIGLIVLVQWSVGWGALLSPWRDLSAGTLICLLALTGLSYLLRAVRVYDLFHGLLAGRFPAVLRLSVLHNAANNLLPMRTGELVFPWLMGRYFGHGFVDGLASLAWIRLLDIHFLGLVGLMILYLRAPSWLWLWLGLAVLWFGTLGGLIWIRRVAARSQGGTESRPIRRLVKRVAIAAPGSLSLVLRLYLWTLLSWSFKLFAFATLMRHFVPLDLWRVLIGVTGAELSSVLPFHGIAGTGSYELAAVAALLPLGAEPAAALIGAVNLHLFLLGATLLFAAMSFALPVGGLRTVRPV